MKGKVCVSNQYRADVSRVVQQSAVWVPVSSGNGEGCSVVKLLETQVPGGTQPPFWCGMKTHKGRLYFLRYFARS